MGVGGVTTGRGLLLGPRRPSPPYHEDIPCPSASFPGGRSHHAENQGTRIVLAKAQGSGQLAMRVLHTEPSLTPSVSSSWGGGEGGEGVGWRGEERPRAQPWGG